MEYTILYYTQRRLWGAEVQAGKLVPASGELGVQLTELAKSGWRLFSVLAAPVVSAGGKAPERLLGNVAGLSSEEIAELSSEGYVDPVLYTLILQKD